MLSSFRILISLIAMVCIVIANRVYNFIRKLLGL